MRRLFSRPRAMGLTTALVAALVVVAAATAFNSGGTPQALGPDQITWTGQGATNGSLDTRNCDAQNDPFGANQPYLLWILTTDGGSIQSDATTPVLHLGGSGSGDYNTNNPSDHSAAHFVTPYFTPDSNLTAFADMIVTATGNGSWNLVISHGCPGTPVPPAKGLTASKSALGSFTRTFTWDISKTADTAKVFSAGGGDSGPVNYTVSVTHDGGTDSAWAVTGDIIVNNPNAAGDDATGVTVTDAIGDPNASCTVAPGAPGNVDPSNATIPGAGSIDFSYTCTYSAAPANSLETNTATVTWDDQTLPSGAKLTGATLNPTADVDWSTVTPTVVDGSVDVKDSLHGDLGTVSYTDPSPTDFTYQLTFDDPAGTCTDHTNTATATLSDSKTEIPSDPVKVTDCQGADLQVTKTAAGTDDRGCHWTISKSGGPSTQTVDQGQPATFNYTVHVAGTCDTVTNVKVTGKITVSNPNDWEDITLTGLTDALDSSGACTVDTSPGLTIPAASGTPLVPGSKTYSYSCNPASLSDKLNTATASWDKDAAHTPNGSAQGTASVSFTETLHDNCVNVSDAVDGGTAVSLGSQFCVTAAGGSKDFTYTRTFTGPTAGSCVNHSNIASFLDNSTPQNGGTSNKVTVQVCSFGPRFTPGYWKNHLAPAGAPGCTGLPSGTSCGGSSPFVSQDLNEKLGIYPVNTILKAANVFSQMSCSFSGNAANQDQQAIGCLAGKLLAAEYNLTINHSNPCIAPVVLKANQFLTNPPATNVTYGGYSGMSINYVGPAPTGNYTTITYTGTSNNQRAVAIALQNALDAYVNGAGCH